MSGRLAGWFGRWFRRPQPMVRRGGSADAGALAVLHAGGFRVAWGADEFERLLADRLSLALVATDGLRGPAVGFILLRGVRPETEILSIAVAPRWRGRGVGRRLLERAFGELAADGFATVFLEVEETNASARRLYAGAGFHEVGRRAGYYAGPQGAAAALVMRRDIA